MAEQRYQAVLAVISDGLSVSQVASKVGVSRKTLHAWLARYEAAGLEGLVDRSHRPVSCPHQMPAVVELLISTHLGLTWNHVTYVYGHIVMSRQIARNLLLSG